MADESMTADMNLATLRRWIAMAEAGFVDDFLEVFTPDYAGHLAGRIDLDLALLKQTELSFGLSFNDTVRTVHELLAFDDRAIMRITTESTHSGEFRGIPPTGRRVRFTALVLYRFREGRISESWTELDLAGLIQQLTAPEAGTR